MASFLNADLPSEDEADESFNPDTEAAAKAPKKKKETSRRGVKIGAADNATDAVDQAKAAKRKASAASKFQELLQQSHKIQSKGTGKPAASVPAAKLASSAPSTQGSRTILSQKRSRHDPDAYWMQALGFVKKPKIEATDTLVARILCAATNDPIRREALDFDTVPIDAGPSTSQAPAPEHTAPVAAANDVGAANSGEDSIMADTQEGDDAAAVNEESAAAAQAASAALRNIAAGLHSADGAKKASMVKVVETRNFAGQEIEVTTEHQMGSKAASSAQHRASAAAGKSGLDAALANITGPKKANTIDKSADDWKGFKSQNSDVKDELNEYNKSSDKYLEKQAFLKKAELTEFEKSRDQRLASDIRTRGRS